MADSLTTQLRDELVRMLEPLEAAATPDGIATLLAVLGRLDGGDALGTELQRLAGLVGGIGSLDESSLESWDGLTRILTLSEQLFAAVRGLESVVSDPTLAAQFEDLGKDLGAFLAGQYLRAHHPRIHRAASLLTLLQPAELAPPQPIVFGAGNSLVRLPSQLEVLHFERLPTLFDDPFGTLGALYFPNELAAAADAHESARLLFPALRALARALGIDSSDDVFDPSAPPPQPLPADSPVVPDSPSFPLPPPDQSPPPPPPVDLTEFQKTYFPRFELDLPQLAGSGAGGPNLGLAVLASSAEHPGGVRGLVFTPTGELSWSETRGSWSLTMAADGEVPAFVIGPGGLDVAPSDDPITGAKATLTIALVGAAGAPAFRLGSATGTRLELGTAQVAVDADVGVDKQTVELSLETTKASLVIAAGDGDGFVGAVLPGSEMRTDFDLGLLVSSATGLHLKGGVGLSTSFPASISVGPASLTSVTLTLTTSPGLAVVAGAAITVRIGPITAVVSGLGLRLALSFPPDGGNVGPVSLDAGFAPPTGIGIELDAGAVTGGGFLEHVADEYAGALDLAAGGIALKAYGLVQTSLPGDPSGYSFIAVISTEFRPEIDLPYGFTLDGVGGLIGVNRSISEDAISAALWAHRLDGLLFPSDPVAAAPQLITALDAYFPAAEGRYVVGPLAKIGWGADIVVGEIAILLELPEPLKILLLGDVQVVVPAESPQLVLHLSFDGGVDFGKELAFFDATLHDSRLESYPIAGDLAFRYGWGDQGVFALALGGFNPQFQPPAGFPALKRLSISISSSVAKIEAQSYLALTSNTLQFGARVELTAGTGSFNVHGWLGFDALCERNPLYFEFDLTAGVDLRAGTDVIASVHLDGTLSGPTPWHIAGKASLSLLFFDVTVHFDKTWGTTAPALPAPDPIAGLAAAVSDRSSWSGVLPAGARAAITPVGSPADAGDAILLDPAATLVVTQRVAPLDQPITRFAGTPLPGAVTLALDSVTAFGNPASASGATSEEFAPSQFLDLSDAEKLSLPSFSRFDSGIELAGDAVGLGQSARTRAVITPISYVTTTIDSRSAPPPKTVYTPGVASVLALASNLSASTAGLGRYRPAPGTPPLVTLAPDRWTIAATGDLSVRADIPTDGTKLEAHLALDRFLATNPGEAGTVQVVLAHEAA